MKTAMQELIELISLRKRENAIYLLPIIDNIDLQELLKKEKQQIIEAVKESSMHGESMASEQAERYYNQTFKQE